MLAFLERREMTAGRVYTRQPHVRPIRARALVELRTAF